MTTTMDQDPGWWPAIRLLPLAPLPSLAQRVGGARVHALTRLRLTYLSYVLQIFLIGLILSFLLSRDAEGSLLGYVAVLALLAGANLTASRLFRRRPLSGDTPDSLRTSYRTMMFLGLALAMSTSMIGFVLAFMADNLFVYLAGALLSVPNLYLVAPRSGDLAQRQEQLYNLGMSTDLIGIFNATDPDN